MDYHDVATTILTSHKEELEALRAEKSTNEDHMSRNKFLETLTESLTLFFVRRWSS